MVEPQGWGEIKEGLGSEIRKLLLSREGRPTLVRLADGEEVTVYSVSWGRDFGDLWEHVTTNIVPPHNQPIHFFHLAEVESVIDPDTRNVLISQKAQPGET